MGTGCDEDEERMNDRSDVGPEIAADHLSADDPVHRAAAAASLGFDAEWSGNTASDLCETVRSDPEATVRGAALGALVRRTPDSPETERAWQVASTDGAAAVRRRCATLAPALDPHRTAPRLLELLTDPDDLVVESAAHALGEMEGAAPDHTVAALARLVTGHPEALVREAAVAALGALGRSEGLSAVMAALDDRPPVRRRAVVALAAFEGPEVEAALRRALTDRDWQVRQAAEDLIGHPVSESRPDEE